jgi:hypothetical protein
MPGTFVLPMAASPLGASAPPPARCTFFGLHDFGQPSMPESSLFGHHGTLPLEMFNAHNPREGSVAYIVLGAWGVDAPFAAAFAALSLAATCAGAPFPPGAALLCVPADSLFAADLFAERGQSARGRARDGGAKC